MARNRMGSREPTRGLEPRTCSLRAARAVFPPASMSVQKGMRGKGFRNDARYGKRPVHAPLWLLN
jgi:hypothetical protein